jgi:signal transduction histidine kinase
MRSIRFRAALAAAVAAAIVFGLGWLWLRHTVYTGHIDAAVRSARADAQTIAAMSFNGSAKPPDSTTAAAYRTTWVGVRDSGEIICGGYPGVDAFLASGQLTLPLWPSTVTTRLGELPDGQAHPLAGHTVTFVAEAADPASWSAKGVTTARSLGTDPPASVPGKSPEDSADKDAATKKQPPRAAVYVLVSTADADEAIAQVDRSLARGLPLAVLFVALVAWLVTGHALRPVDKIRARLVEVSTHRLSERVPVPATGDELSRLATTINETLDRLDHAVTRQRRFVADAAHELRSPLTGLRSQLDVALAHPDRADWPEAAAAAVRNTKRLQALAADLLLLARLDQAPPATAQVVDLAGLVTEQVAERAHQHPDGPTVTADTTGETCVPGDPSQLERLLRNLLDNATRHATTTVTVSLRPDPPGHVILTVTDDGPGIPSTDRDRVFDRFARLDHARSRDYGGAGLGLPIARDIATAHGGTLTIGDNVHGTTFITRLPAAA